MMNGERGLAAGTIVYDQYVIDSVLGEGGFGITYLATKQDTGNMVAVKEYFPLAYGRRDGDTDQIHPIEKKEMEYRRGKERFVREASVLQQFDYLESIVKVWDCFEINGTAYIIMDYIDGITLKEYVAGHGGLNYDEWMKMLSPVLRSLITLHKHGVIHRDISPDNLMIGMDNRLYLIDFGAARELEYGKTTTVLLKVGYAPPEQYLHDGELGPWTDIYAICATTYTALCGKIPADAVARLQGAPLVPLAEQGMLLEDWQWSAIQRGMRMRAAERYQNVEELYDALTVATCEEELPTVMDTELERSVQKKIKRWERYFSRWESGAITAVMLAVIVLAGWQVSGWMRQRRGVAEQEQTAATQSTTEQRTARITTEQIKVCKMPDVAGMPEENARSKISQVDSRIQVRVKRQSSETVDKGLVILQSVEADTQYNEGAIAEIVLTISDGKAQKETATGNADKSATEPAWKYDVKSNETQTQDFYLDE